MPAWHHSNYDPWIEGDWVLGLFAYVVLMPIFWILLPLVWVLVQLPLAAVRALGSDTRWVVAYTRWPGRLKLIWKSTKADARNVADHVAAELPRGYDNLTPPGAELVYMSEPAGLDDLDR
jgi:hypothetical protein